MNGTVTTSVMTTCKKGRRNGTATTAVTTTCKREEGMGQQQQQRLGTEEKEGRKGV